MLELASFICVTSIEALTHNAVLYYSKTFSDETMQALIDESARLVTGYLKGQERVPVMAESLSTRAELNCDVLAGVVA
jgi:hypothetical protein